MIGFTRICDRKKCVLHFFCEGHRTSPEQSENPVIPTIVSKNSITIHFIRTSQEKLCEQNYKAPHLIATRKAFWLGTFSKIQSMFTNIPITYAKTVPKDPKRKGLKVTIAPLTNKLA